MQALTMTLCVTALTLTARASGAATVELPRKASFNETYPGAKVDYEAIRDPEGHRLRLIVTHPVGGGRAPAIFMVGWLSCDSIEVRPDTMDGSQRMIAAMARLPGFVTVRLDKHGVGDSEGDCGATDFKAELSAYRQAFRSLRQHDFIDLDRVFLFGMSNGGGFAPLVAEGAPVKGYVVMGGWTKTWFEHMLEIERRRLLLSGRTPAEINGLMKSVARLYSEYLLDQHAPSDIFARHPEFKPLWEGPLTQQYGRPVSYYQQLQELDLMAAWSEVRAPVLAMHGQYDWIMSRGDYELMVEVLNHKRTGGAEFVELPDTGHTFEHYDSWQSAFRGAQLFFDEHNAKRVADWILKHRD